MEPILYDEPFILQARVVDKEDVEQEAHLLRLQGIEPNRRIIRMKLSQGEPTFSGDPGALATPIATTRIPPTVVIEMLLSWALQHRDELVTFQVLDFLDEPDEVKLDLLVRQLKGEKEKPVKERSLSEALYAFILQSPGRNIEDIYEFARTIHQSKRPEAAVRQFLRRAVREGRVIKDVDTYTAIAKEK
jgi:hypothetical protein